MYRKGAHEGTSAFLTISCGQIISVLGSGLTGFALSIWVLQRSGSATRYGLLLLFATLPSIVLTPLAGAAADRWSRLQIMLLSDAAAGLVILSTALSLSAGALSFAAAAAAAAAVAACGTFRSLAYQSSVAQLVPKSFLGRASGIVQVGQAASSVLAPLAAGVLTDAVGLRGVLLIDFASYCFAVLTVASARGAAPVRGGRGAPAAFELRGLLYGWTYIRRRPPMLRMLLYFAAVNVSLYMASALVRPLILSFASAAVLGVVVSSSSAGLLAGALLMGTWGGPARRVRGILGFGLLLGMALSLTGLRPNALLVAAGLFVSTASLQMLGGCTRVLWQLKTPPEAHGRVFAASSWVVQVGAPLAYLSVGPLADRLFEPLLDAGGPLAGSVGRVLGTGPGRGMGLLVVVLGTSIVLFTAVAWLDPRLRAAEEELPDGLAGESPAGREPVAQPSGANA
jgi:MFS transporter, DHA3 family, macrolide efflux protein